MASAQELLVSHVYCCYHCGAENGDSSFKYFDNKKLDQPRYQCQQCDKFFTLGSHGRPQGRTYAKKRNEDPPELKHLSRQCRHCGVADHSRFKYYNNKSPSQPRFKCLSCGQTFQMRLLGTGEERHLVHTTASEKSTRAPRRRKEEVLEPLPNACSSFEDGSYQPYDGSFLSTPSVPWMPPEDSARLLPEMSDEDAQYSNFLEAELVDGDSIEDAQHSNFLQADEENIEADLFPWIADRADGNLPPPFSDEGAEYLNLIEADLLREENGEAPNDDAFSSTANADGELPPTWSNEDARFMDFTEVPAVDTVSDHYMAETGFESTSDDADVMYMYGTLMEDGFTTFDSGSWSQNDTSTDPLNMSYAEAAAACCHEMDMDMACKNSLLAVAPVESIGSECSSSSPGLPTVSANPFCVIPEPVLDQLALSTEAEQCFDFQWNEDDEGEFAVDMSCLAY